MCGCCGAKLSWHPPSHPLAINVSQKRAETKTERKGEKKMNQNQNVQTYNQTGATKPEKKIRAGAISATIWKNTKQKDGKSFEAVLVDTDLKFDCETFLHCRELHKWGVYIENNHKQKVDNS
mgnify:CR=1 FL=1